MKRRKMAGFTGVFLLAGSVLAGGAGLTGKVGTLGIGADLTVGVTEKLNIRAGGNFFDYDFSIDSGEIDSPDADDITGEISWQSFAALIDWHMFGGHFRLTGGMMLNNNEINLTADPGASVELGDAWDGQIESLSGTIEFDDFVPYVGIGVGNAVTEDGRWNFAIDLGVMFQGSPELSMTGVASDSRLQSALDNAIDQELADLEEDVKDFDIYPVISIGVSYKFF